MGFKLKGSILGCILAASLLLTSCTPDGGHQYGTSADSTLRESEKSGESTAFLDTSVTVGETTTIFISTSDPETTEIAGTTQTETISGGGQAETTTGGQHSPSSEINVKYENEGNGALRGYEALAGYAFVADAETHEVIYLKGDPKARIYPASITKLVTAFVALEYCPSDAVFTVGSELSMVAWDSSVAGLKRGDRLTLDDLIYCLLLPSGGDAAYVIAAGVGRLIADNEELSAREAVAAFVSRMNEFADRIGMDGTVFTCPDGYHDDGHYTTLEDLVRLGIYCVENDDLYRYTSVHKRTVELIDGGRLTLKNSNPLVDPSSQYYRENVDGLKTGTTDEAGNCLMASGDVNGRKYLVGAFLARTKAQRSSDVARAFDVLSER